MHSIRCGKIFSCAAAAVLAWMMALLLAFPARYGKCVLDGLTLWALTVLPATLPFLFLAPLFTGLKAFSALSEKLSPLFCRIFRISGAGGCAALLSAISGYPVGAKTVGGLYACGKIGKEESFRVAAAATTTGPAFLVGAVGGGMFQSAAIGWLLFFCHLFGVWSVCFLLARRAAPPPRTVLSRKTVSVGDALSGAVTSALFVGGAIALFYVFGAMLCDLLPPLHPLAEGTVRGVLEMTAGCAALSAHVSPLSLALCCFLVTFGGLCVLTQQIALLGETVKPLPFLGVKFAQAAVAGALCFGLAFLL